MRTDVTEDSLGSVMARFVANHIGLHFPPERETDLLRGLRNAARNAGLGNAIDYSRRLLSASPQPADLHHLAAHLTIGETYFFREEQALRALSQHVLPKLIAARRGKVQRLRLWSAACSTGEEAYSLAILLQELLPDWNEWELTILATDINPQSLEKASAGVYGEWSFRALPAELRRRYFTPTADRRSAISESIRRRVNFVEANLAADSAPEFPADATGMDVILCRNVLIYFTAEQGRKLVAKLHAALAPGGCLVVSPSEFSQHLFADFMPLNFPGTLLYRKPLPEERIAELPVPRASPISFTPARPKPSPAQEPRHPAVTPAVRRTAAPTAPASPSPDHGAMARTFANQGKLGDALASCERWIEADKVNPAAHYLHATVLHELDNNDGARRALQRCIYLQPDFALAHFALGNLARGSGQEADSQRHYRNANRLLEAQPPDAPLPESEGLTAGRVAAIVRSLLAPAEAAASGNAHALR